jgi:hypothetical protein
MGNREETNGRQDFTRDPTSRSVPKSQHDSPSPEGSLIPASGRSPDSRFIGLAAFPIPGCGISGFVDQPSTITVAGPSGFTPGSLLSLQRQHQSNRVVCTTPKTMHVKQEELRFCVLRQTSSPGHTNRLVRGGNRDTGVAPGQERFGQGSRGSSVQYPRLESRR